MNCQLILTNKIHVCAAVLLLWVMEAMFNRICIYTFLLICFELDLF